MSHDYSDPHEHSDRHTYSDRQERPRPGERTDADHEFSDRLTEAEQSAFESLATGVDSPSPDLEDRIVAALRAGGFIGPTDTRNHESPAVVPVRRVASAAGTGRGAGAQTWWRPLALAASIVIAFGLGLGVGRQSADGGPIVADADAPPIVDAPVAGADEPLATPTDASFAMQDHVVTHVIGHDATHRGRPAKGAPDVDAIDSENDLYTLAVLYAPSHDAAVDEAEGSDDPFIDVGDPAAGCSSRHGGATIVKGVQPTGEPRLIARP